MNRDQDFQVTIPSCPRCGSFRYSSKITQTAKFPFITTTVSDECSDCLLSRTRQASKLDCETGIREVTP